MTATVLQYPPATAAKALRLSPLGRIGQPGDIATVAAFLASDESFWLTGQTIQASGGARL